MTHLLFLGEPTAVRAAVVGSPFILDGAEGRHAATVVRVRAGQHFYVSNGQGRRVLVETASVERSVVRGTVVEVCDEPAPSPAFVLVQALAKGDRDEQAVEAATELGVDEVVPWQAERSVVVWRPDRVARSLARWEAVVTRATKQSRRSRMPLTAAPVDLAGLVERVTRSRLTLVLHEAAAPPLSSVPLPDGGEVLVVVGPEGGISERELDALVTAGAHPVRLGRTILRASSAGPAALAVLSARTRWR